DEFSKRFSKMEADAEGLPEESGGELLDNLVLFIRLLRERGFEVSGSRVITIVNALEIINIASKEDFYHALFSLLVSRKEEIPLFDHAFSLYWKRPGKSNFALAFPGKESGALRQSSSKVLEVKDPVRDDGSSSSAEKEDIRDAEPASFQTYSKNELLRQKDFSEMDERELSEAAKILGDLIWQLGLRRTRREKVGKGSLLDFRRSLRGNLRYGGELLLWSRRTQKLKPRSLVILADISGSMEQYSRMLLHFAYLITSESERAVEVFVFSTQLTRITRHLQGQNVENALREVGHGVPDWSGGTRIGQAVKDFNYLWARRLLSRGAVVLLISDGWDRGEPELLKREMSRLQRSCHRLIWLNPLLGSAQYEPLTRGMKAALPFVDDFLPIHNLTSIDELTKHLARLDARSSSRTLRRAPDPDPTAWHRLYWKDEYA
ncbi:MAG: vWA domain-containing protein, partial [Candidatus Promineifilaceae bacterium]